MAGSGQRDLVLVERDADLVRDGFGGLPVDPQRPKVGEDQMGVGAPGDDTQTLVGEARRQRPRVAHGALGVRLELG